MKNLKDSPEGEGFRPIARTINSGNNSSTIGGNSSAGPVELTIVTNSYKFPATNSRNVNTLTIKPLTPAATIGVGGGTGPLKVDANEIATFDNPNSIVIGDATSGERQLDVDSATFSDPVTIVGGSIQVDNNDVVLEPINVTAIINLFGQELRFQRSADGVADGLTISSDGTDLTFNDPSNLLTSSIGTGSGSNTVTVALSAFDDLVIETNDGSDTINLGDLTGFTGTLSLDGQSEVDTINLTGTVALGNNEDLTAIGDTITASANADLDTTGSGSVTFAADRNIDLQSGARVATVDGGITMMANQQATRTSGNFSAITAAGATIATSGTGSIQLQGRAGDDTSASDQTGVNLSGGAIVESTSTSANAGQIKITGTGGDGIDRNYAVALRDTNTRVSSASGDIQVTGMAGTTTGGDNKGVLLIGGKIESTGSGVNAAYISVTGTAGAGASLNDGVGLVFNGSDIASVDGDIMVTGTGGGGTSNRNFGVILFSNGRIRATGDGNVTVNGTGGFGTTDNEGVGLENSSTIESNTGTVTVTATGRVNDTDSDSLSVISSSIIQSGGSSITLNTDTMDLSITGSTATGEAPGQIIASGNVTLANPFNVEIGGTTAGTDHDQVRVEGASRTITINNATLNITPTASLNVNDQVVLIDNVEASSQISGTFNGLGEGQTFNVAGSQFSITYQGGTNNNDVVLTKTGTTPFIDITGGNLVFDRFEDGVADNLTISATGGNLIFNDSTNLLFSIVGTGNGTNTVTVALNTFADLIVKTANSADTINIGTLTGFNGSLTIDGETGVDTVEADGTNATLAADKSLQVTANKIRVENSATLATTGSGTLTLTADKFIEILTSSTVSSANGDLNLKANQGVTRTSGNFSGIIIDASTVKATESGAVKLVGRGGTTGGSGVVISNSSTVGGQDSNLDIIGVGGNSSTASSQTGVLIYEGVAVSITSGRLKIMGTGGDGTSFNKGVDISGNVINTTITSTSGDIEIVGTGGSGTGEHNTGVQFNRQFGNLSEPRVQSTNGNVTITGTAGTGSNFIRALFLELADVKAGGNLTYSGSATGSASDGVVALDGIHESTSNGSITANATGDITGGFGFRSAEWITANGNINLTAGGSVVFYKVQSGGDVSITSGASNTISAFPGDQEITANTATFNGELAPIDTASQVILDGNAAFGGGSMFNVSIFGNAPGATQFSQLRVEGAARTVNLNNATLDVDLGPISLQVGDQVTIVDNVDSGSTISSTFNGRAEGSQFTEDGVTYQITYQGGTDNNNVVLQVISAPAVGLDFGDAPSAYAVTLAENGARHLAIGPTLGPRRDNEADGIESSDARADNNNQTANDEYGVTWGSLYAGFSNATVIVNSSGAAKLDAWIDFDQDGVWGNSEQIFDSIDVAAGDNTLNYDIPSSAKEGNTFSRFRLSTAGGLDPTGEASDGEVEDHLVRVLPDTPFKINYIPGGTLSFPVEVNAGFWEVAATYGRLFSDEMTYNFLIEPRVSEANASANMVSLPYETVRAALVADQRTPDDVSSSSNLQAGAVDIFVNRTEQNPNSNNETPYLDNDDSTNNKTASVPRLAAKALGLISKDDPGQDGSMRLGAQVPFDYDRSDGTPSGVQDLNSLLMHEMGHANGFSMSVFSGRGTPTPSTEDSVQPLLLDLFRFSTESITAGGAGTIDLAVDARSKYFSVDGGQTKFNGVDQSLNDQSHFVGVNALMGGGGQVALGDCSPRAPTDPYVRTLPHTVHLMMDSPCSNAAYPKCYPGPCR